MKKRILALSLAAALVVGALASCTTQEKVDTSSVETRSVSLTLWGAEADQDFLKSTVADFAKQYADEHADVSDVTVDVKIVGEDQTATEALKDINAAADVFGVPGDQTASLADAKAIYAMPDDVANEIKALVGDDAANGTFYNGSYYGFPYTPNTAQVMYYNKEVYTEDDVKSLNTMLEKDLGGAKNFGIESGAFHSTTFYFTAGGELFTGSDKTVCTFDSPECAAMLAFVQQNNSKIWTGSADDAVNMIKDGQLAAWLAGSWDIDKIEEAFGKDKVSAVCLPKVTVDGKEYQMKCFGGIKYYAVNAASKEPEVAIALAQYLTSEDVQLKRFEARRCIPTAKSLADNAEIKGDATVNAYVEQNNGNVVVQEPVIPGNWWSDAEALFKDIHSGKIPAAKIQEELTKHVASWKEME